MGTKFEALPEDWKNRIKQIEKIKEDNKTKENLLQPSFQPMKDIRAKIVETQQNITSIKVALERDKLNLEALKHDVFQALKNTELASRMQALIQERQKSTLQVSVYQGSYQVSSSEYFWRMVSSFEGRMHMYKQVIEELERNISSLLNAGTLHPQVIVEIIRSQHESFLAIASHVRSPPLV